MSIVESTPVAVDTYGGLSAKEHQSHRSILEVQGNRATQSNITLVNADQRIEATAV